MGPATETDALLNLLCLEDSPADAELIRELLTDAGFRVRMDRVATEKDFASLLREREYDAILADFTLPGFDAPAALRFAAGLRPEVPFICVSGTIGEDAAVELLKQGAADYVLKDRLGRLAFAVRRALDGVTAQKARRQAEKSLRESRERYRQLVENSHDIIFALNADGTFTFASPSLTALLGYDRFDFVGRSYRELIHPDDVAQCDAVLAKVSSSGQPQAGVTYRIKHADGSWRWHASNLLAVHDHQQNLVSIVGNARDVTDSRRMEARLALHTARLEALLELHKLADAPEAELLDYVLEETLRVVESKFSWIGLMDETESVMTIHRWSKDVMTHCATADRPIHYPVAQAGLWGDAIRQRRPVIVNDYAAAGPGRKGLPPGHLAIKRLLCVPVFDGGRIVAAAAVAGKDADYDEDDVKALTSLMNRMWEIVQRRRDRHRIEHLNRVLRAIRDVNQLITHEKDPRELIRKTCQLLVETRGYGGALIALTDEAGRPVTFAQTGVGGGSLGLAESLRQGTLPPCFAGALASGGVPLAIDRAAACAVCPATPDCALGDSMCVGLLHGLRSYGCLAVTAPHGLGWDEEERSLVAAMAADIAFALYNMAREKEAKRLEEARHRAEEQLRQAQKMEALGTLAGGIAHDFNNILGIIIGYTEMARWDAEAGSPLRANLQEVIDAANRAKKLVRQILAFSRRSEQEKKPLQVGLIVSEALKMLRASLPSTIEIRSNVEAKAAVVADPTQVHQVLMNLCTNAAHAMRNNGGVLEVSLTDVQLGAEAVPLESALPAGPYVRLAVKDTGHGIDPGIMDRIFDPFFTTKEVGVGTGLGLSVVHGIVQSHGGAIEVESFPGKGTTFRVLLPAMEDQHWPEKAKEVSLPRGRERVLIVDDEPALAMVAKQMLERLGYEAHCRTSSIEALEAFRHQLREKPFDLVITDMTMPNMTGVELTRRLLDLQPGLPVVLCTGFSEKINAERVRLLGIRGFLMKPVVLTELAEVVRKVLDEGRVEPINHGQTFN